MPEVAVHKHGYPGLAEHDIRFPGQFFDMLAEPQPFSMEAGSNLHLKSRILSLDAGHAVTALLTCKIISHFIYDIGIYRLRVFL
jgi:hypothetical protein